MVESESSMRYKVGDSVLCKLSGPSGDTIEATVLKVCPVLRRYVCRPVMHAEVLNIYSVPESEIHHEATKRLNREGALEDLSEQETDEHTEVSNPNHYNAGDIECIDAIRASMSATEFQGYCKGNVEKYVWRYRYKAGVQDLKKAEVYLKWLIESLEEETEGASDN